MDKTPICIESVTSVTINAVGAKEILIKSTDAEKLRITVVLTARRGAAKLKSYIVIPRKRLMKSVEQIKQDVCACFNITWMDDDLICDELKRHRRIYFRKENDHLGCIPLSCFCED